MARLIDADALIDFIDCGHLRNPFESCFSERDVVNMLEARPTVDAVEVVRCKECKHWYEYSCNEKYGSCHFWQANDNENTETESDDFCSYGQRKDGAE